MKRTIDESIDEIADKLNWPRAVDSHGKRVYTGTWLSGDNNPDHPPIAKVTGFRDDVVLVDMNPARRWEIKTPKIVECRLGTDSCGWVRANEQLMD